MSLQVLIVIVQWACSGTNSGAYAKVRWGSVRPETLPVLDHAQQNNIYKAVIDQFPRLTAEIESNLCKQSEYGFMNGSIPLHFQLYSFQLRETDQNTTNNETLVDGPHDNSEGLTQDSSRKTNVQQLQGSAILSASHTSLKYKSVDATCIYDAELSPSVISIAANVYQYFDKILTVCYKQNYGPVSRKFTLVKVTLIEHPQLMAIFQLLSVMEERGKNLETKESLRKLDSGPVCLTDNSNPVYKKLLDAVVGNNPLRFNKLSNFIYLQFGNTNEYVVCFQLSFNTFQGRLRKYLAAYINLKDMKTEPLLVSSNQSDDLKKLSIQQAESFVFTTIPAPVASRPNWKRYAARLDLDILNHGSTASVKAVITKAANTVSDNQKTLARLPPRTLSKENKKTWAFEFVRFVRTKLVSNKIVDIFVYKVKQNTSTENSVEHVTAVISTLRESWKSTDGNLLAVPDLSRTLELYDSYLLTAFVSNVSVILERSLQELDYIRLRGTSDYAMVWQTQLFEKCGSDGDRLKEFLDLSAEERLTQGRRFFIDTKNAMPDTMEHEEYGMKGNAKNRYFFILYRLTWSNVKDPEFCFCKLCEDEPLHKTAKIYELKFCTYGFKGKTKAKDYAFLNDVPGALA